MGDRTVDNGWAGELSFVPSRNGTEIHTARNRYTYHPLKRIPSLDSMITTARRLRSTIKIS